MSSISSQISSAHILYKIVHCTAATLHRNHDAVTLLASNYPFHSPLLEGMLDDLERAAAGVAFGAPRVPLVSNLTGEVVRAEEVADPRYWRRHARERVRFADGMAALRRLRCQVACRGLRARLGLARTVSA